MKKIIYFLVIVFLLNFIASVLLKNKLPLLKHASDPISYVVNHLVFTAILTVCIVMATFVVFLWIGYIKNLIAGRKITTKWKIKDFQLKATPD